MISAYPRAELDELDEHWGEDYDLAVTSAGWVAKRLDNGRALVAANPGKLQMLIAADSGASPDRGDCGEDRVRGGPSLASASSALAQAAALRAAFPGYMVSVLVNRRDRPRFEVVSQEGGDPYCLISSDAQEIWRELRGTVS